MLVISKKRILFLTLSLILSISYFSFFEPNKTVFTSTTPVSSHTVVLDAGHGFPDEGAFLLHKENTQLTFYK